LVKILKLEDAPKLFFPDGKAYTIPLVTEQTGAKEIAGLMGVMPAGSGGVRYHYHDKRESVLFILSGQGKALVEGKEYGLGPNTVMFVPPKQKHKVMNVGNSELRYIEFFTNPPMLSDFVEVVE
jgi:mannose-6-phosphate isomerase-like protein (cupin superfamily)